MRRITAFTALFLLLLAGSAAAQQFDVAFGVGSLSSKSAEFTSGGVYPIESIGGGAYPSVSADFLLWKNFGFGGEVAWRGATATYAGFQPYRPILFDVGGVWAPELGTKRLAAQLSAGIGLSDTRFYTPYGTCDYTGCTNYYSSKHLLGAVGGGLKIYAFRNFFIRPEVKGYFIRNNNEFTSGKAYRVGASIGWTFRPDVGP